MQIHMQGSEWGEVQLALKNYQHDILSYQSLWQAAQDEDANEDINQVNVRRSRLVKDAFQVFSRHNFNPSKPLQIRFVGKAAINAGGPLHKLFALFHTELAQKHTLFEGHEGHKEFMINIHACRKQHFETIGRIMAASIIHGVRALHFFTRSGVEYAAFGSVNSTPNRWVSWCWSHWQFETSEKLLSPYANRVLVHTICICAEYISTLFSCLCVCIHIINMHVCIIITNPDPGVPERPRFTVSPLKSWLFIHIWNRYDTTGIFLQGIRKWCVH